MDEGIDEFAGYDVCSDDEAIEVEGPSEPGRRSVPVSSTSS